MRAWQTISFFGCVALAGIACGGESTTAGVTGGGSSGASGSSGVSGGGGDSSGIAGSANGGAAGSTGSSGSGGGVAPDASTGSGGTARDASVAGDGPSAIRDAASERTAVDGACTEGTTDRCDTCTDARCCAQVDACEANAACKAAFAKIDACIGDSGSLNRIRNCYTTFEQTDATARNLGQCVANRCTNQCRL